MVLVRIDDPSGKASKRNSSNNATSPQRAGTDNNKQGHDTAKEQEEADTETEDSKNSSKSTAAATKPEKILESSPNVDTTAASSDVVVDIIDTTAAASDVADINKGVPMTRRQSRTGTQSNQMATPVGAFHSYRTMPSGEEVSYQGEEIDISTQREEENTTGQKQEEVLLEATLVTSEDREREEETRPAETASLPMAVDAEILKTPDTFRDFLQSKKGRMSVFFVSILILILLVGTIAGMTTRDSGRTGPDHPTQSPSVSLSPSRAPTRPPTNFPTIEPTVYIPELFEDLLPIETQQSIQDPSTPQAKAFAWVQQDTMFQYSYERMLQRFVLATLYYATSGDNWIDNELWLSYDDEECMWFAGLLDQSSKLQNCGIFRRLNLYLNGLQGEIPTEVGLLTSLEEIHLSKNNLTGTFPPHLSQLTLLRILRMSGNTLSGNVTSQIGNLASLAILDISDNKFIGSFPTQVGHLHDLVEVTLNNNNFHGGIPTEIGSLVNLRILHWASNQLQEVPTEFGNLPFLSILNLHDNTLQGPFPSEFGRLTQLRFLRLHTNSFTGSIPVQLSGLTRLEHLDCGMNNFTGGMASEIFGNWTSLSYVSLRENQLTGTLPSDVAMLSSIRYFDLANNNCSGSIPSEIGMLSSLEFLDFSNNSFTGEIPPHVGNLTELDTLNLRGNNLSGTIPTTIGQLNDLRVLDLSSNSLHGDVWPLNSLTQLTSLGLAGNLNLTGELFVCDNLEHEWDEFLVDSCQQLFYDQPEVEPMVVAAPTPFPAAMPTLGSTFREVGFTIFYRGVPDRTPTEEELEGVLDQTDQFFTEFLSSAYRSRPETELYSGNFFRIEIIDSVDEPSEQFYIDFAAEVHFDMESTLIPEAGDLLAVMATADWNVYVWDFVVNSEPFGTSFFFDVFSVTFVADTEDDFLFV